MNSATPGPPVNRDTFHVGLTEWKILVTTISSGDTFSDSATLAAFAHPTAVES